MSAFLSVVTDKLMKTTYQNTQELTQIDIKDDSLIVNLLSKFILPILLIFGFYVHTHGDYVPGGGFQAGVIFACALCLYYFMHLNTNRKRISQSVLTYTAMIGFACYVGLGILGYFITGKFLDYSFLPFKLNNARGVFIVELGILLVVFSSVARTFITLLNLINVSK